MQSQIKKECEPFYLQGNEIGCLLIHGYSSSPFEMRYIGEKLHQLGYTISSPLLDGHGIRPDKLLDVTWYDWFITAKNALIDLRKKCNKIFVIGSSMGGTIVLHLAAHYEVNGVIALAPGLYLQNKFAGLARGMGLFKRFHFRKSAPDIKNPVETHAYQRMPIKTVIELLDMFEHVKMDLPDIYAPVLILHAKNDHVIDGKSAEYIYRHISSKTKRIFELQESYHIITLDIEKEKVFLETANFIAQTI